MPTYRFVCVRGNQKTELIATYESLAEAKIDLHKQGYTVVESQELDASAIVTTNIFYFETTTNGRKVLGQIEGDDAFKIYVKLTEKLGYTVEALYQDKNTPEAEKRTGLAKLQEYYRLYQEQQSKKTGTRGDSDARDRQKTGEEGNNRSLDLDINQYTLKEIKKYHALMDRIIEKIQTLSSKYTDVLSEDDRSRLGFIRDGLLQSKSITNIDKLRNVGEDALVKIGNIEKGLIEKHKLETGRSYIQDTNELLRNFGSREKVLLDEDDVMKKFKKVTTDFFENLTLFQRNEDFIDKSSGIYFKTLRELNTYRQKLREVNHEIFSPKNLFSQDTEKKVYLRVKKRLILQNIRLIKNRLSRRRFSYTKIAKGVRYYEDIVIALIGGTGNAIIYALLVWSSIYVAYRTVSYFGMMDFHFNPNSLLILSFFGGFAFLSRFISNITLLAITTLLYSGFVIFLQVNF